MYYRQYSLLIYQIHKVYAQAAAASSISMLLAAAAAAARCSTRAATPSPTY
jgi:hypothetical protein